MFWVPLLQTKAKNAKFIADIILALSPEKIGFLVEWLSLLLYTLKCIDLCMLLKVSFVFSLNQKETPLWFDILHLLLWFRFGQPFYRSISQAVLILLTLPLELGQAHRDLKPDIKFHLFLDFYRQRQCDTQQAAWRTCKAFHHSQVQLVFTFNQIKPCISCLLELSFLWKTTPSLALYPLRYLKSFLYNLTQLHFTSHHLLDRQIFDHQHGSS